MNGLLLSILLNTFISIGSIFLLNYLLLNKIISSSNLPDYILAILILSVVHFLVGITISIFSSMKNCNRVNKKNAFKQGFRHIIYFIVAYLIVFYVSIIRDPFLELFGTGFIGYSIAQSFIVTLNTITATIINYYTSIKVSCKVPQEKIEKELKKLDKFLNKKPTKRKNPKITIKD